MENNKICHLNYADDTQICLTESTVNKLPVEMWYKNKLALPCVQKFFQIISHMLDMENVEKWEDAHQVKPSVCVCVCVCVYMYVCYSTVSVPLYNS